jgi:hypothetical protein
LIYDNLLFLEVRLEMRRITTARIVNSSPHWFGGGVRAVPFCRADKQ